MRTAKKRIDEIKENKDTAGGIVEIRVNGLKSGFGSCMSYSEKLDGHLAGAVMGIQAIKGVESGSVLRRLGDSEVKCTTRSFLKTENLSARPTARAE